MRLPNGRRSFNGAWGTTQKIKSQWYCPIKISFKAYCAWLNPIGRRSMTSISCQWWIREKTRSKRDPNEIRNLSEKRDYQRCSIFEEPKRFHFEKEEGRSHRSKQKRGCTFYTHIDPKLKKKTQTSFATGDVHCLNMPIPEIEPSPFGIYKGNSLLGIATAKVSILNISSPNMQFRKADAHSRQ